MTTVARKAKPKPRAISLRSFLSMAIRAAYLGEEYSNSEVIRSIMAVMASQRLMSEMESGKYIGFSLALFRRVLVLLRRPGLCLVFGL